MKRYGICVLGVLWIMAVSEVSGESGTRVEQSLEVLVNSVAPGPGMRCAASTEVGAGERTEWWVVLTPAQTGRVRSVIECGIGVRDKPREEPRPSGREDLHIRLMTVPRINPPQDPYLEMDYSIQGRSHDASEGPSANRQPTRRSFYFAQGGEMLLPVVLDDPDQRRDLGIHEVIMRMDVRPAKEQPRSAYGAVSVVSTATGAHVLVDGGVMGVVHEDGVTNIPNLAVGEREVGIRDASGQEIMRVVSVEEGRRVLVGLDLSGPDQRELSYGLKSLGSNAHGYEEYRRQRDGAVVVKIPAGEFLMGNKDTEREPLEHKVYLSEYLIDKTEVSWGQFKRFAAATARPLPPHDPYWGIHDDHPAVFVTWEEAKAHCEWAGGRLATEAEWEKAARGTDERKYPWGNEEPTPDRAVFRRSWGFKATDPVTAHPEGASPYGVLDMGGSNWEWCADWFDNEYYEISPARDPRGPSTGRAHVVRGGSWDSRPTVLSCSCRSWGHRGYREGDFGFRCAMDPP